MDSQNQTTVRATKVNPVLLLFLIFPILGIVAALAIGGQRSGSAGMLVPPAVEYTPERYIVGSPAPDFTLQTLDGQPIQLSSLRGQWVFLNFWATWCPPCRQEMPTFQRLLNGGFGPVQDKVAVLAVDALESANTVSAFMNELDLSIPVALDSDGAVNRLYRVLQLPITFVVDPAGVVRYEQLGEMTPELLQKYLDQLTKASQQ
jgi:peroxiredoxin